MKFFVAALIAANLFTVQSNAKSDADIADCLKAWGKTPFKAGASADKTVSVGVKVFGIGKSNTGDTEVTPNPKLILIKPAVNVLGKSTIRLENPNGWYCFKTNVSVLGKINIEAHCKAHIANSNDGANVLGADDSNQGVTVLGSLRISRFGCEDSKTENKTN